LHGLLRGGCIAVNACTSNEGTCGVDTVTEKTTTGQLLIIRPYRSEGLPSYYVIQFLCEIHALQCEKVNCYFSHTLQKAALYSELRPDPPVENRYFS